MDQQKSDIIKKRLKSKACEDLLREYKQNHPIKFIVDNIIPEDYIIILTQKIAGYDVDLEYSTREFYFKKIDDKYEYKYKTEIEYIC